MAVAAGARARFLVWLALLTIPTAAFAQPAVVQTSYGDGIWVGPAEPLEILLDRFPDPIQEGRIVVFIGPRDVSALVEYDEALLRYRPFFVPLPNGTSEVAVYLVTRDERWIEIDRRRLQVGEPPVFEETFGDAGFSESQIDPYMDVAGVAQVVEHSNDDFGDPIRHRFVKGSVNAGWNSRHVVGGVELTSTANFVGATFKEDALRFAQQGREAPRFDLSDYLLEARHERGAAQIGHITYGNHRHLLNAFASRGVRAEVLLHDRVDVSAVAMSANRVVGHDNLSGLSTHANTIGAATLGLQVLQNDYGNVRLEGMWMSGSRESVDDFNVGQITDAEKSLGYGARFLGDFWNGRIRSDVTWSKSRFDNPVDSEQTLGFIEFEGETTWDDAVYAEGSVDVLRDLQLSENRFATFTLFGSYERIDPLYKSLGAFTFSDTETILGGFVADLGGIILTAQRTSFEDNLDDIDQILKTRSHDTLLTVELPLPFLMARDDQPLWWLPLASYSFDRFHEWGSNTPGAGSGFDETSIPNQITIRHDAILTWTRGLATATYSFSWSHQDNRQPGRSEVDFRDQSHALDVNFSVDFLDGLNVGFGAGRTQQWSLSEDIMRRTLDYNVFFDLRFFTNWTLRASAFFTRETDSENSAESDLGSLDGQLSYDFSLPSFGERRMPGRVYVRASRNSSRFVDNEFDFTERPRQWTLLVGTSITLF